MKANKYMREAESVKSVIVWINKEISSLTDESVKSSITNPVVRRALVKVRARLESISTKDPLWFLADKRFGSIELDHLASGEWTASVLWGSKTINAFGPTYKDCIRNIGKLLK